MIEFFKRFIASFQPVSYTLPDGRSVSIVQGGEPIATVIVEGVGLVGIPSQTPSSLDS